MQRGQVPSLRPKAALQVFECFVFMQGPIAGIAPSIAHRKTLAIYRDSCYCGVDSPLHSVVQTPHITNVGEY